jgi:hypothetical protein
VRPTDEDQSGPRRPNLMSSTRRSANEIHILAMLDRHESKGRLQRMLRGLRRIPSMFWYGAAGVLVTGLAGTAAWLARDGGAALPAVPAVAAVVAPDPVPESVPAGGAAIVDLAPVLAAEAAAPASVSAPPQDAARIAPGEVRRDPPRPAPHAAPKPAPRNVMAKASASGPRPAAPAHADARSRRPAASAKPAPDAVDTDVALISAIIQHAGKRQEEDAARK